MVSWVVIGAGPAGSAAAIALARRGHQVHVYERAMSLEQYEEDSYPIGLNPRGMEALDRLDDTGALRQRVTSQTPIDAWNIYSGSRRVVRFESGTTVGATRGGVALSLYEEAQNYSDSITYHFGHKLTSVDFDLKTLEFEVEDGQCVQVDASKQRLIAADGVASRVRRDYELYSSSFSARKVPWQCGFRLLFSGEGANPPSLNAREHYIFSSGIYVAVVNSHTSKWVVAIRDMETSPDHEVLQSENASPENCAALKSYVAKNAPLVVDMIPEEEYERYFSRRMFSGSVLCVPTLNVEEWVLFIGDAAHSVYPATGEGVNCALEDSRVFGECLDQGPLEGVFERFHKARHSDVSALTTYAEHVLKNSTTTKRPERIASVVTTILMQMGQKLGLIGALWSDKSFGTTATDVVPYRQLLDTWKRQIRFLLPVGQVVGFSIDLIIRTRWLLLLGMIGGLTYWMLS